MFLLSLLTDPGFRANKIRIIRPIEAGPYTLSTPYGELGDRVPWALLTDGITVGNQIRPHHNTLGNAHDGYWRVRNNINSVEVLMHREEGEKSRIQITCDTRNNAVYGCGEVDALLCAITPIAGLIDDPGMIAMDTQPSLADMASLTITWREMITQVKVGRKRPACPPGYNCALTFASIYVKDVETNQTLQYEYVTSDSRNMRFSNSEFAYVPHQFLGIADSAEAYTSVSRIPVTRFIDILPRLREIITSNEKMLSPRLDTKKILMASWGPFNNGSARVVVSLDSMDILVET